MNEMMYEMKNTLNCGCEHNFSNCTEKPEKFRTSTGFEPVTLRYRCNALLINQLSYEAIDIGRWSFLDQSIPVMIESMNEMIYERIINYTELQM